MVNMGITTFAIIIVTVSALLLILVTSVLLPLTTALLIAVITGFAAGWSITKILDDGEA